MTLTRIAAASLALACCLAVLPAAGDDAKPPADKPGPAEKGEKTGRPPMPPDATVEQKLVLPGRTLKYRVTAGSLPLVDDKGEHKADIFYLAYLLDSGKPAADRPVTFAFNGGPGASAAYLNLGAIGPRRLEFGNQGEGPSTPPKLEDNPDTWLDFTDLVFVDPVGTGYSSTVSGSDEDDKRYWGVSQDVDSLSAFIAHWLVKADRMTSPHYLVGESYGGFRGPKILHHLQTREGVGIAGAVFLSPALDSAFLTGGRMSLLPDMARLPSLAASALAVKGPVTLEQLKPVEQYAEGEFLTDLAHGRADPAAADRVAQKVADLTGLDPKEVKRLGGQIGMETFARDLRRDQGLVGSVYDATVTGYDAFPHQREDKFEDPILAGTTAPITSAIVDFIQGTVGYKIDQTYRLLNYEANGKWDWNATHGEFPTLPNAVDDLQQALALDHNLKVIIAHGMTDTITPYFATRYIIDHMPDFGDPGRLRLEVYPGGHMSYTRDASRAALRADAAKLYPGG